jgi:hypothetical protein
MRRFYQLIVAGFLGLAGACQPDDTRTASVQPAAVPAKVDTTHALPMRPAALSPALHRTIRQEVARINAVRAWSGIRKKPLYESTEGGEAVFYTFRGQLRKVLVQRLGETGRVRCTYYLVRGQPAFIFQEDYTYNRPITWDSVAMREGNDTEVFDPNRSVIVPTRSYFDAMGHLVAQVGPSVQDSLLIPGYLTREQHRLRTDLAALLESE